MCLNIVVAWWICTPSHGSLGQPKSTSQVASRLVQPFLQSRSGVDLPVADEMKVLGFVLDCRLSFDRHVTSVARACNYHVQAIRHILHLLTTKMVLTLACSLILSRLDYCNAVLHGAPASSIQKLQQVQNTAARVVLQSAR